MKTQIEEKLRTAFDPVFLEVKDDSHLHAGHAHYNPAGNTHFSVTIVSPAFTNLSRLDRHQQVYACLEGELKGGVHALSLKVLSPQDGEALGELG